MCLYYNISIIKFYPVTPIYCEHRLYGKCDEVSDTRELLHWSLLDGVSIKLNTSRLPWSYDNIICTCGQQKLKQILCGKERESGFSIRSKLLTFAEIEQEC